MEPINIPDSFTKHVDPYTQISFYYDTVGDFNTNWNFVCRKQVEVSGKCLSLIQLPWKWLNLNNFPSASVCFSNFPCIFSLSSFVKFVWSRKVQPWADVSATNVRIRWETTVFSVDEVPASSIGESNHPLLLTRPFRFSGWANTWGHQFSLSNRRASSCRSAPVSCWI